MKKKLFSFFAMLALGTASTGSFAQVLTDPIEAVPVIKNTITRNACLTGYQGCSGATVTLRLSSSLIGSSQVYTNTSTSISKEFPATDKKIKVTIGTLTNAGAYTLPTAVGDQVVIPSTDGLTGGGRAYTVIITKTADKQFSLGIAEISL